MDLILGYWNIVVARYGIVGLALFIIILILFIIQLRYWLVYYGSVASFRLTERKIKRETQQRISVIVPLFAESRDWLENGLTTILQQNYPHTEVVVVYVGSDLDFYADLKSLKNIYAHLVTSRIEYSAQRPISTKMALNIGIKAANYENIIVVKPDFTPTAETWLDLMAKGFQYGDIVIGYTNLEVKKGMLSSLYRRHILTDQIRSLAAAIAGQGYTAQISNYGFTRDLYFESKGFNFLNLDAGENDLYLQKIITEDNCAVVLSPNASMTRKCWGGMAWWIRTLHFADSTRKFYPSHLRSLLYAEPLFRVLFFVACVFGIVLMPLEYKITVGVMMLLRFIVVAVVTRHSARRVGEYHIGSWNCLYDIFEPIMRFIIYLSTPKNSTALWRK